MIFLVVVCTVMLLSISMSGTVLLPTSESKKLDRRFLVEVTFISKNRFFFSRKTIDRSGPSKDQYEIGP